MAYEDGVEEGRDGVDGEGGRVAGDDNDRVEGREGGRGGGTED